MRRSPAAMLAVGALGLATLAAAVGHLAGFARLSDPAGLVVAVCLILVAVLVVGAAATRELAHADLVEQQREAVAALRRQEALLARTEEMAGIGGWEWDLLTGDVHWSAHTYVLYGFDPESFDPLRESFRQIVHPDDRDDLRRLIDAAVQRGEGWSTRIRIVRPDGAVRVITSRATPGFDADGTLVRISGFTQDVTDLVAAEEEARNAERRYRELVERLPAVLYIAEAPPRTGWRLVSGQIEQLLGYTQAEWLADPTLWDRCVHPDDRRRVDAAEAASVREGTLATEFRMLTRDGRTIWVRDEALVREAAEGDVLLEGMLTDVTARKAFEGRLQYLADHDPLTSLSNRRRFIAELTVESQVAARGTRSAAVVMLDLDNFKHVNDSLGHQAGDALIREVAAALGDRLRASDTLSRLGGDEFAALLRGTSSDQAVTVAGELLEAIRERTHELMRVSASAGVVELTAGGEYDPEELLAAADLAMYRAKQEGRDRVAVFTPDLQRELHQGRSWADRIRDALERDRLSLFCQPVIDLRTGAVTQWEILVCMLGERGEIIPPEVFLPVAERFGLIVAIDRWVIRRAVKVMEDRLAAGERIRLEVNVSGISVADGALPAVVEDALARSPVDPGDLILELTEAAAIANMDAARSFAERLGRLGCRLALHDFGSGFASFYYLKHLALDLIKIDGDFVQGMTRSEVDEQIVIAMIGVAHALGLRTVAESVADEPTLQEVRRLGVDFAQGFHVGVPRPVAELGAPPSGLRLT